MPSRTRAALLSLLRRHPRALSYARRFAGVGFAAGVVGHVLVTHGYVVKGTYGVSMMPTMMPHGEAVLISKLYRRGRGVQIGDLVSMKHPFLVGESSLKRVVGLPGDFVLRDSPGRGSGVMIQVSVGLTALEWVLGERRAWETNCADHVRGVQIPEGHCWVAGDNQEHSRDSRLFGPQPLAMIRGKAIARLWPPSRVGWFENTLREAAETDEVD